MLFDPPKLDALELDVIGRIEDLKRSLRCAVQTPKRWPGLLRRALFAKAIMASNSIEGFNVTVEDAIAAVEGDEPLDAADADWRAVRGYRSARTYVLQLADDSHFKHSTLEFKHRCSLWEFAPSLPLGSKLGQSSLP